MPASPQYRYTRDEQQLSHLLRAIDGVTTRLAARYEKLSPTVAWALYELSGRSAPDPSANTYVAWRI